MLHYYNELENTTNTDLVIYNCGEQKCNPKHSYGPIARPHFTIHYILEGEGSYEVNNKSYRLKKNQGFLICPGDLTYYRAHNENPWHYIWVGFHGSRAKEYIHKAGLSQEKLLFLYDSDRELETNMRQIIQANKESKGKDVALLGYMYLVLNRLIVNNTSDNNEAFSIKEQYVKEALRVIQGNYHKDLSMDFLCQHLSISRSYLFTLFKEHMGMSPKQYIMDYRIRQAVLLMKNKRLNITDVARSVGYEDPLVFSKMFKKNKKMSPKFYRKMIDESI